MAYSRKRYGRNSGGLLMGRPMFPMNMPRSFGDAETAANPFGEYVAVGSVETAANPFAAIGEDSTLREQLTSSNIKTAAALALTYHGYKRTGSIVWALVYGTLGKVLPLAAVPIALAQGFGQKKAGCP
jgi:hypothetical protein